MNLRKYVHPAFLLAILASVTIRTQGGFPGIFCPRAWNNKVLLDCNKDCQAGHNAVYGRCGPNYDCYCSFPKDTVHSKPVQCLEDTHYKWAEICTIDCQCDHGALGGRCNYKTRGCECGGSITIGKNVCPFKRVEELIDWFNSSYTAVGHAQFAEEFLTGKLASKGNAQLLGPAPVQQRRNRPTTGATAQQRRNSPPAQRRRPEPKPAERSRK